MPAPGSTCHDQMPAPVRSEFAEDEDFRELLEPFVASMPEKRRSLADLFRNGQIDELGRLAHQLKGAAGGYGFPEVSTAAALLQEACHDRDAARVEQVVNGLLELLARVTV
jgi:HPt (histidine-containing phosphotransfer) domain-containing protein